MGQIFSIKRDGMFKNIYLWWRERGFLYLQKKKPEAIFKYALITEHVPITADVEFNLDKITGPHIRMRVNSRVFIDKPPFNINHAKILFEYREDDPVKGKLIPAVVRTYLLENQFPK